jgi:hypothetical protein
MYERDQNYYFTMNNSAAYATQWKQNWADCFNCFHYPTGIYYILDSYRECEISNLYNMHPVVSYERYIMEQSTQQ